MSISARDQISKFLSLGLPQSAIAAKLSVSPGLVSQIANEEEIKQKVTQAQLAFLDAATERDQRYNELEDELLEKAKKALPTIYKPQDIMRALLAINKAERRGASSQQMAEILAKKDTAVIELELPERLRTKLIKSHTREVVEINGRKLVTKDSRLLYQEITESEKIDPLDIDLELPENYNGTELQSPTGADTPAIASSQSAQNLLGNPASISEIFNEYPKQDKTDERPQLESALLPKRIRFG